jgi:predicted phosphodiesterase
MLVSVASDLHLSPKNMLDLNLLKECDILILAGDCFTFSTSNAELHKMQHDFARSCSERAGKVIFVPGNHEYYGTSIESGTAFVEDFCGEHDFILLNDKAATINGQHFIGSTLWTDFDGLDDKAVRDAFWAMSDFNGAIRFKDNLLKPIDTVRFNDKATSFLIPRITTDSIVITHHTPSMRSCHERWGKSALNYSFHNDLDWVIEEKQPKMWIHGHTHDYCDYMIDKTRVLCNPRGYCMENTSFDYVYFNI